MDRLYSIWMASDGPRFAFRRFHLVYSGALRLARTLDGDEALEAFESDQHSYVAEAARTRLFVHAGVVGWRDRAILVPGSSLSGKTTLVVALVRAGATYYSDEYAVLDGRGRVHPYPTALSIREPGRDRPRRVPAVTLGRGACRRPLPVGLVVVTAYRPGVGWRPRPLSAGQAALALLANTVAARRRPAAALGILRQVAAGAGAIRSARGDADAAARSILSLQRDAVPAPPRRNGRVGLS